MLPLLSIQPGLPAAAGEQRYWTGRFIPGSFRERNYWLYIPPGYRQDVPVPLLVMLHGCGQTPQDFAIGTEMNRYADQYHLLVLYPEQPRTANPGKCWNWFRPDHQMRESGEPAEIVDLINRVSEEYAFDRNRVYAAGISAGAAMATILGATYPDVFSALGMCAGVVYKASTNVPGSLLVMARGNTDPRQHGQLAYQAMGSRRRVVPVIVFHGTRDTTVSPRNSDQVIAQWFWTNRLVTNGAGGEHSGPVAPTPTEISHGNVPNGRSYTASFYADQHGMIILQKYLVDGMKHGWPGGSSDGSFTDPLGPKASQIMLDFLLHHTLHPVSPTPQPATTPPPTAAEAAEPPAAPGWLRRLGGAVRRLFKGRNDQ